MRSAARRAVHAACAAGIFLAFVWPFAFGADPASEAFHVAAVATLIAFLAAIAATLCARR